MGVDWKFEMMLKMGGVLDIIEKSKILNKLYRKFALNEKNSLYFESDGPFYVENQGKDVGKLLWILSSQILIKLIEVKNGNSN